MCVSIVFCIFAPMKRSSLLTAIVLSMCMLPVSLQAQGTPEQRKDATAAMSLGELDEVLGGSSTLFFWEGRLWSCNDHGHLTLYAIDTATAALTDSIDLGVTVNDLEEVTQDEEYFYFGDFGNNSGSRTDLHILRLAKSHLAEGSIAFDTIHYSLPPHDNLRDMDCEAFVAADTALYLFTKQWVGHQSECYRLPKEPGTWAPTLVDTLPVEGLVTGACYQPERQLLVLCGYSLLCKPFVYLCYGFEGHDFGSGTQAKVELGNRIGTQTEGIASRDGLHYYLTSEHLNSYGIEEVARLWSLDLTPQLGHYLYPDSSFTALPEASAAEPLTVYPNPTTHILHLPAGVVGHVRLYSLAGQLMMELPADGEIDLSPLPAGTYTLRITLRTGEAEWLKVVKTN